MRLTPAAALAVVLGTGVAAGTGAPDVQHLRAIGGLPPHLAGAFAEITACHLTSDARQYLVFDRREHAVYRVDPAAAEPTKVLQIGFEQGRLLKPIAFDSAPDGTFAVADAPEGRPRIQVFVEEGSSLGGFTIRAGVVPFITLGDHVLSGVASIQYTGRSVFVSQPETGRLVTEYDPRGGVLRSFGELRATGHERDQDVHYALNTGLPLVNPKGGFYYVFLSGRPMFRKYDAKGSLVFERHIEGVELDTFVQALPTTWTPRRAGERDEFPIVPASVRTAAVDPDGHLWISLAVPYTYVYDASGDKRRTLQFRGAGVLSAAGFYFTRDNRVLVTPGCYAFRRPQAP
jgi:hypothetical protein